MDNFVSLDPGMMIWVWVTFGILLFLLSKFAWKPILNAIESIPEPQPRSATNPLLTLSLENSFTFLSIAVSESIMEL